MLQYPDGPHNQARILESNLIHFTLPKHAHTYGYMLPEIAAKMPWTPFFQIHRRSVHAAPPTPPPNPLSHVSAAIAEVLATARKNGTFELLNGWRDELYPIVGAEGDLTIERAGAALFGIVTMGVHMTAYTRTEEGLRIWVPRRAATKQTYPGMLDNTVAGGISAGETPFNSLVREASEEASLPEEMVRKGAKACGTVSYFHIRDKRAGGETGLLQPEVQYVYDLEVGSEVVLKPSDDEVQEFYLWTVERVQEALAAGEFKPNCAVVLLDFFVRHGILTAENERDYAEIVARLHRKLPFPTARGRDVPPKGAGHLEWAS